MLTLQACGPTFDLQEILILELASAAPEGLAELTPTFPIQEVWVGLTDSMSNKFPGDADAADPDIIL